MSKKSLELLESLGLISGDGTATDIDKMSDEALEQAFQVYARSRKDGLEYELEPTKSRPGEISLLYSSVSTRSAVPDLLSACLISQRVFLDDPLVAYGIPMDEASTVMATFTRMGTSKGPDRPAIRAALGRVVSLAPLIRDGAVIMAPLRHQPPDESLGVPLRYDPNGFRSEIPDHLYDFIRKFARVREFSPGSDGKPVVRDKPLRRPTRGIKIDFVGDCARYGLGVYFLFKTGGIEPTAFPNRFDAAMELPWDQVPSKGGFDRWVEQSINATAANRLNTLATEIHAAETYGSLYLTESGFEAGLLRLAAEKSVGRGTTDSVLNFLRAVSPELRITSAKDLARLRSDHSKELSRFQASLVAMAGELTGLESNDFERRSNALFQREIMPQVDELNRLQSRMRGDMFGGILSAASVVSLALLGSGTLPFAGLLAVGALHAAGQTVSSCTEYMKFRKTPAFIWKQMTK